MKRLQIFREFEDGFVLFTVRQFLGVGISENGDYDPEHSPLPDFETVVEMIRAEKLFPGNSNSLVSFRYEHAREYLLNRVYALSVHRKSLCWINSQNREVYPDYRFNCNHQRKLLLERAHDHLISSPVGYGGELCVIAIRPGHEKRLTHFRKTAA